MLHRKSVLDNFRSVIQLVSGLPSHVTDTSSERGCWLSSVVILMPDVSRESTGWLGVKALEWSLIIFSHSGSSCESLADWCISNHQETTVPAISPAVEALECDSGSWRQFAVRWVLLISFSVSGTRAECFTRVIDSFPCNFTSISTAVHDNISWDGTSQEGANIWFHLVYF